MRHAVERLSLLSSTQVLLFDFVAVATFAFVMSPLSQPPPQTAGNIGESQANEKRIAFSFERSPRGADIFLDVGQRTEMAFLYETDLSVMFVADLAEALRSKVWQIVSADSVYADLVAKRIPDSAIANGTWLVMLAWENDLKGDRWFPRNDVGPARKLFVKRVLRE